MKSSSNFFISSRLEEEDFRFSSLSNYLDDLPAENFNELLIRRLLVPFLFLCSTTRRKILPRILIPKDEENGAWISIENFRQHAVPILVDLFSYHVTAIRLTLLEHFQTFFQLIDQPTLVNVVLPQVNFSSGTRFDEFSRFVARLRIERFE